MMWWAFLYKSPLTVLLFLALQFLLVQISFLHMTTVVSHKQNHLRQMEIEYVRISILSQHVWEIMLQHLLSHDNCAWRDRTKRSAVTLLSAVCAVSKLLYTKEIVFNVANIILQYVA